MLKDIPKHNERETIYFQRAFVKGLVFFFSAIGAFNCGKLINDEREVHDHRGQKMVSSSLYENPEPYDEKKHGPIKNWLYEGDKLIVNGKPYKSTDGRTAIHRHVQPKQKRFDGSIGAHEYTYE